LTGDDKTSCTVLSVEGPAVRDEEQPGGRAPAPGGLAVVQAFVNTNDIEGGEEQLSDPGALSAWLSHAGLCPKGSRATQVEFSRAIHIREGLRALGCVNNDEAPHPASVERFNQAASRVFLTAQFEVGEQWHLAPAQGGVMGAFGHILGIVAEAMADGTWERMKACKRDRCRWLFYDHSKNRSGLWCTMQICGNKEKAIAYRRRLSRARAANQ